MPRSMPRDIPPCRSSLVPRNVVVEGRRTSIRLENAMWDAFNEILLREGISASDLVTAVARTRAASSLTAAIRVHIMHYFRTAATEAGHRQAGHGALPRPGPAVMPRYRTPATGP
jgi:predicted DNA-binding ribbon-helix-helix protein